MLNVNLDGVFFTQTSDPAFLPEIADQADVDISRLSIPAEELAAFNASQTRENLRRDIAPVAGDTQSIQGTIADNVGLLLEGVGKLATAISASTTIDPAIKAAAEPLAEALTPLLEGIENGSVKLTHHVKGIPTVIQDAGTRATAVSTVLEANANP